ncbi:plasmid partitioning protein RepB [Mangrovicoccus sp. HB161399]|uniref:plasmid partitioning protein RepB n=1 Tax=Mangrovicoccus sp. HB161399 TaxID=2720392 RepID=UPI0020A6A924|nr:plasmid partitioning protein RepB [Mangrovicoccus sp. HB161399]
MAMGKNKTGIMAAITAAAEAKPAAGRAHHSLPKGTIGSVRAGLGGIQDIDTNLILAWGPKDRMDVELTGVNSDEAQDSIAELAESIRDSGQQVPVLLRPSTTEDGHFEVVYGRRRILACKQAGLPVKALIRTMDDSQALMAKGLENAGRAELSFYERARFALSIGGQGYERAEIMQALAISKNTLSQLERITRLVPAEVGDAIGPAPGSGRPKWMSLAQVFERGVIDGKSAIGILGRFPADATSDERLDGLLREISRRGARSSEAAETTPVPGVTIRSARSSITMSVKRAGVNRAFSDWLDGNLEELIRESYERFRSENPEA